VRIPAGGHENVSRSFVIILLIPGAAARERQLTMRSCVMRPNDTLWLILQLQGHFGCIMILRLQPAAQEILRQIMSMGVNLLFLQISAWSNEAILADARSRMNFSISR